MEALQVGLHARINRLDVFTQSSRRSLAVKLIKVARTTLEVLLGGFSGVKNACECVQCYGWADVGWG